MVACRIFSSPHDIVRRPRCCCCCCSLRRFSMRLSFRDRFVRISRPLPHLPHSPLPHLSTFFFHSNCLSTIAFLSFQKKKKEKKKRFSSILCPEIIQKSNETKQKKKKKTKMKKRKKKNKNEIFFFFLSIPDFERAFKFRKMKTFRRMEKRKKRKRRRIETKGEVEKKKNKRRGISKHTIFLEKSRNCNLNN